MLAIQDHYPEHLAYCHGCGWANPDGLQLKSFLEGDETIARFTPAPVFSGGVPGYVYGGLIASLIDCHGTASASAFAAQARGTVVTDGEEAPRYVTGTLAIEYRRPTPMGVELTIRGRLNHHQGRKIIVELELAADDEICARGEMIAVEMPEEW